MRTQLIAVLLTLTTGFPAIAADEKVELTREGLLAHSEIQGALAAIDAWVEGRQIYDRIPGVSIGIVHDQDVLWSSGYGYSNLESERPADADTLYSICSISKLFTAISLMQLRDEGHLTLRDPVEEHLDWFDLKQAHEGSGPITIEGLMTHSSGLPRESDFPYWNGPDFPFPTREEMISRLDAQETLYPAHKYFQYSNLAWTLAGEIVAETSGQSYDGYVREHILDPLGLTDTRTFYPDDLRGEKLAIGYTGFQRDQARDPVNPFFTRGITAAAGFTSSVNDLAGFASWQFRLLGNGGEEILDANTLREMQRVHWVDPDWKTTWGLGFNVRRDDDITFVSHGGGCPGYITSFTMVPKQKTAAIVLTNAGDGPADNIAVNVLKVFGAALKQASEPEEGEMPDFSMYEGNYEQRPWGGEVAVRQWGDKLVIIDIPSNNLKDAIGKLEYDGDHTFTRLDDDDERRNSWVFETDEDGEVTQIRSHSSIMRRIP